MKNLLNSTDIATLFLDKELNIRRYTNQATKIFKLIKSDIGRPFTDQVSNLIYPELADDALEVLRTLIFIEKQIPAKDGRWFSIKIMPYRTFDDRIDGLVITFINISDSKRAEEELNETLQGYRLFLNSSADVIIKLSADFRVHEFNLAAEKFFGKKRGDIVDQDFIGNLIPESGREKAKKELTKMMSLAKNDKIIIPVIPAKNSEKVVEWSVNVLLNNRHIPSGMIITKKADD